MDDVQWLDEPTAQVLAYVLRRASICTVLSHRTPATRLPLGLTTASMPVRRVEVGALPPLGLGQVVASELGEQLDSTRLRQLHDWCRGNPLHAIEIVRRTGWADGDAAPRIPGALTDLLEERLRHLSPAGRRSVLVCSALASPKVGLVREALGSRRGLDEAVAAEVLVVTDGDVHLAHPLLASVAAAAATASERRAAHRRLVSVLEGDEREIHLALATARPDGDVAMRLDRASAWAAERGAAGTAAELADHALRLTPRADRSLDRRTVQAAQRWLGAGDARRSERVLRAALTETQSKAARAELLLHLATAEASASSVSAALATLDDAVSAATGDVTHLARIEHARAFVLVLAGQIVAGHASATRALELARQAAHPGLVALATARVAVSAFTGGLGFDRPALERAVADERHVGPVPVEWLPSFALSTLCGHSDDLVTARHIFAERHRPTVERVGAAGLPLLVYQSLFECWAGDWAAASDLAQEAVELSQLGAPVAAEAFALGLRGLMAAHRGLVDDARRDAEEGQRLAMEHGAHGPMMTAMAARGFLDLSLGDAEAALRNLEPLIAGSLAAGVMEPGFLRFLADGIEALVAVGRLDEATTLADLFEGRSRAAGRNSTLAAARRCGALLAAARGDDTAALTAIAEADDLHAAVGQPFERARTELVAGQIARRAGRRGDARRALSAALATFTQLEAPLWTQRAADELARLSGRRPGRGELSWTQTRVLALVVEGNTNRQIAEALFYSVRTVEASLTEIYRRFGVRTRAQLVRAVLDREETGADTQ